MKLEVGMYVRTKYGIAKIIKTDFINEYLDKPFLVVDRELEIGLIGGNDTGIFFFTTDGKYIEWTGTYLYSDIPFIVDNPIVKVGN